MTNGMPSILFGVLGILANEFLKKPFEIIISSLLLFYLAPIEVQLPQVDVQKKKAILSEFWNNRIECE
jgi:hypothetical protein